MISAFVDVAKGCSGLAVFVTVVAVWIRWDNRRLQDRQAKRLFRGSNREN